MYELKISAYVLFAFLLVSCGTENTINDDVIWNAQIEKLLDQSLSDVEGAFSSLDSLLTLADKRIADSTLARAHLIRGVFGSMQGKLGKGKQDFNVAHGLYEKLGMDTQKSNATLNLANLATLESKLDLGVSLYIKAINECGEFCEPTLISKANSNMSLALFKLGEYDETEERVRTLLSQPHEDVDANTAYTLLGDLAAREKDTVATRNYYIKALEVVSKKSVSSMYYANTAALLASYMDDAAERIELIEIADSIYHAVPVNYIHLETAISLWRAYGNVDDFEKEASYYDAALELSQAYDNAYNYALVKYIEAKALDNDSSRYEKIALLDDALSSATGSGAYGVSNDIIVTLRETYESIDDEYGLKRCEALFIALNCQREADKSDD